jgi:hypothetical protein
MTILNELIAQGFEPITEWVLKGDRIGPRSFDWKDHSGWIYAFVIDGDVKYIGLTTRVLRSRMSDYSPIRNAQTDRIRALVLDALSSGKCVEVFGLRQRDEVVLATEEARLRMLHRPSWNRN